MADDFGQYMSASSNPTEGQAATPPPQQVDAPAQGDFSKYMDNAAAPKATSQYNPNSLAGTIPGGGDAVKSAMYGAQQAGANMVGGAVGDPELTKSLEPGQEGQQLMEANPTSATVGKIGGYVGGAGALATGIGEAAAPVIGRGLVSDIVANGLANSILAGPGNRVIGAVTGGIAGGVTHAVSDLGKFVVGNTTIGTQFKDAINKIGQTVTGPPSQVAATSQANVWQMAKATEDKLFNNFRSAEGQVEASPISHKAIDFLQANSAELTPVQKKSVMNLIENVNGAHNIAELHDARKIFSYDYNKFAEGKPLTEQAFGQFKDLTNTMSSVMENNANKLGVGNQFAIANRFYKETVLPLMNSGAKDTADALKNSAQDPMAAAKITDGLINKYINPGKPEVARAFLNTLDATGKQAVEVGTIQKLVGGATDTNGNVDFLKFKNSLGDYQKSLGPVFSQNTNDMFTGLNKTIDEATHLGGMEVNLANMSTHTKLAVGAGALGAAGAIGYHEEGTGSGVALAAGGLASAVFLHKMLTTPVGQSLLMKVGSEPGRAGAKALMSGAAINAALMYGNFGNGQADQQ